MFTKYFDFDPIRGRVHVLYLARFLGNMFTAPKLKVSLTPLYFQRGCCMWSLIPPPSSSRSTPLSITRTRYLGRCTLYDLLMKLVALLLIPLLLFDPDFLGIAEFADREFFRLSSSVVYHDIAHLKRPLSRMKTKTAAATPFLLARPSFPFCKRAFHSIPDEIVSFKPPPAAIFAKEGAECKTHLHNFGGGGRRGGEGPPADRRD